MSSLEVEIRKGESARLEFKLKPSESFLKTVVAFANCGGGKILFGVSDDRSVVGIDGDVFKVRDGIVDAIADAVTPTIEPQISFRSIDGKCLIELDIAQGMRTPYCLKSLGPVDGVFVRYDATTRQADDAVIRELTCEGGNPYDRAVCRGMQIDDRQIAAFCRRLKSVANAFCETAAERRAIKPVTAAQLESWGVLRRRGGKILPTNAYALLSGAPQCGAMVKCALFKGTVREEFLDRREFEGPIYAQIDAAHEWVLAKINRGVQIIGARRRDVYEIPPDAIRELITNAVMHRSYVNCGASSITVALYDDRLEITSPGGVPRGSDVKRMAEGYSLCRNEVIARVFAYLHYAEMWGLGLPKVFAKIVAAGLPSPEIVDWGNAIRIVVRRRIDLQREKVTEKERDLVSDPVNDPVNGGVNDPVNDPVKGPVSGGVNGGVSGGVNGGVSGGVSALLNVIRKNPGKRVPELAELMGISRRTVERYLKDRLLEYVEFRGAPKNGGYYVR